MNTIIELITLLSVLACLAYIVSYFMQNNEEMKQLRQKYITKDIKYHMLLTELIKVIRDMEKPGVHDISHYRHRLELIYKLADGSDSVK